LGLEAVCADVTALFI